MVWVWWQLQEQDRKRAWSDRMQRINTAILLGMAFNEPDKLANERRAALADARRRMTPEAATDLVARAKRMARYIRKGRVLS